MRGAACWTAWAAAGALALAAPVFAQPANNAPAPAAKSSPKPAAKSSGKPSADAAAPASGAKPPNPAQKPDPAPKPKAAKAAKKKPPAKSEPAETDEAPAAAAPASPAQKAAYAAMPVAERLAVQSDLVWSGDLTGGLDPEFGDRAIAAVKSFQRRNRYEESGILTPEQRQTLAGAMRTRKDYNGWRLVEDEAIPGVRLGIPSKLVPQTEAARTGSRWTAARGEIQIETFREKMAGSQLSELFEEMKKRPSGRRTETSSLQTASFSIAGLQGLKRFYVRGYLKDNEARGITILFDQAMEGIMLPMVDTITNSFLPFGDPAMASASRKVEYGSGFVVSDLGHVVTERQLTENCQGLIVAGLGRAERIAEDKSADLALLRVHGAASLKPLPFSSEPPRSIELTLVGVPEPDTQAGGREVTTSAARLRGVDGTRVLLDIAPTRGFVGGVALDGQGQFAGMIDLAPVVTAGPPTGGGNAALVPTASIRRFLDSAGVTTETGKSDLAAAKDAVMRVICVRK